MSKECNLVTTIQFIQAWQQKPDRLLPELASLHNETHRKPDSYHFELKNGALIDPETGKPVKEFIQKETYLGKIEFEISEKLERWAEKNEEGLAFWISPPFHDEYPCSKIIVHRIAYTWEGEKVLTNSAILFGANAAESLEIIPSSKFKNPEDLRKTLFVTKDNEEVALGILASAKRYSNPHSTKARGQDLTLQAQTFAEMITRGASSQLIVEEMKRTGFLGQHSISCSGSLGSQTFSGFMLSHSNVINLSEGVKFVKRCGACGHEINNFIPKGYQCPRCGGVYEGC